MKQGRPVSVGKDKKENYTRSGDSRVLAGFRIECMRNGVGMSDVLQDFMVSYVQNTRDVRKEDKEDFSHLDG